MSDRYVLLEGDCLEVLKQLPSDSVDSLVTDPPAGISFMGKDWDDDKGGSKQWIAWMSQVMKECLRVLKPGAHGLVWAIPRTSHWTATALEDAGFEIRDVITHIFGSGFPKSLDISKAIDKAAGVEREVLGIKKHSGSNTQRVKEAYDHGDYKITAPATPEAKQWQGWGTAIKPASEHWILVRKPLSEKTVANNVLKHGTGGINIDASRISVDVNDPNHRKPSVGYADGSIFGIGGRTGENLSTKGRFPANLVLSHNPDCVDECTSGCAIAMLDEQSGFLHGRQNKIVKESVDTGIFENGIIMKNKSSIESIDLDKGGASRFFYCAKASKSDKGENNTHPTVKSTKLMSYLIKMITPPNGIVLDPFLGSGSTGVAALRSGFDFIGIEKEIEYYNIANKRLEHVSGNADSDQDPTAA